MTSRQETDGSFFATAIRSTTEMRHAINLTTREYDFHKMPVDHVDFLKLWYESPDWLTQNNFSRIRSVSALSGWLFWSDFLGNMEYPVEKLRGDLFIPEDVDNDDYTIAGHEMYWRSQGFGNAPLMFALSAACGKHTGRYIRSETDEEGITGPIPPVIAAVRAGKDFGHAAFHPTEYYERLAQLFPDKDVDSEGTAWTYLFKNDVFEMDGKRCPGSGLTRTILAEFGKVVATDEFRTRILTGK